MYTFSATCGGTERCERDWGRRTVAGGETGTERHTERDRERPNQWFLMKHSQCHNDKRACWKANGQTVGHMPPWFNNVRAWTRLTVFTGCKMAFLYTLGMIKDEWITHLKNLILWLLFSQNRFPMHSENYFWDSIWTIWLSKHQLFLQRVFVIYCSNWGCSQGAHLITIFTEAFWYWMSSGICSRNTDWG